MNYKEIEPKWQKEWDKLKLACFDKKEIDKKYYVLEMFSYPSGANLHLGHVYNFAPSDTFARFKKMQGYSVFQPMGFDAFGLPAENYAIKTGVHPKDSTDKNIEKMRRQLKELGAMYDWNNEVITCNPEYYRWTQWIFLQFYKKGLAYQKDAPVNWCTSCNTAIANEQAEGGICERCGSEVLKKNMTQWFFKITDYAEELLSGLENIDWPEKTKAMQRNWIGKSIGAELVFPLINKVQTKNNESHSSITVFTTRPDTLMGVSYVVLSPEHPLVPYITSNEQTNAVKEYQYAASKLSDVERMSDRGGKTGVFTGGYCFHPVTNQKVPVWIADYCLSTYGTGAVMGVPAHDTRDYDFAKKYKLDIKQVITPNNNNDSDGNLPFTEYGTLINSMQFDGMKSEEAKTAITDFLCKNKLGKSKINYRLRDWSVSRQRYWGCPIPIINCEKCGNVPVAEKDLPVTLPYDVNFTPDGKSPLAKCETFINTTCPICGSKAQRESDTLDTFICSSWYFLRYPDANNQKQAFDTQIINKMLPVDKYIGGPEHACMHLLYSRFFTKALRDMGYLSFDEPFKSLVHQGMILGTDGEKMSKNKGNIVNPDKYFDEYGSDVLRMYLMFAFSYVDGGPWSDDGIKSMARFLDRTERIVDIALQPHQDDCIKENDEDAELLYALNYCIKNVRQDLEIFSFNTAIARLMELVNAMYKYSINNYNPKVLKETALTLIRIIAPFAPHFAEELNQRAGVKTSSVFNLSYPEFDENKLQKNQIEIAIQINSKIASKIMINPQWSDEEITKTALADAKTASALQNRPIKKAIIIKERLINLIV